MNSNDKFAASFGMVGSAQSAGGQHRDRPGERQSPCETLWRVGQSSNKNSACPAPKTTDLQPFFTALRRFVPPIFAALCLIVPDMAFAADVPVVAATPWWVWPIALFTVTFLLGVVAVLGGVGGGVLFVPIVSGFFPFHLDFVRGAGLLLALCGALAAGPLPCRSHW